jgi:class 3 adenylate cyclase
MKVTQVLGKVKSLGGHLEYESILNNLSEILVKDAGAVRFAIFLHDEAKNELFSVKTYGYGPRESESRTPVSIVVPVDDSSLLGVCVQTGSVIELEDVKTSPQLLGLLSKGVVKTVYAGPLQARDKIVGAINIEQAGPGGIGKFERTLLDTVCTIAGLTMSNARLFDQTRKDLQNVKEISAKQRLKNLEIKDLFGKYVSKNLVDQLLSSGQEISLGGGKEHVVALFSDIRGFTTLCEGNEAEDIVELLNEYFSEMTEAIFKYDGTLDKFIGDAIMALFGVPVKFKNPHLKSVLTALEMQARLKKLQQKWASAGKLNIDMGIGINCGMAIVGNIGSMDRMDYTAIGDTINLAARLEENAKRGEILISEAVFLKIRDYVVAEPRGPMQVKGKKQIVKTFNVVGVKKEALKVIEEQPVKARPGIEHII